MINLNETSNNRLKMKILFFLRKNRLNERGECAIYCRITYNNIRSGDFSTTHFVKPENWNLKTHRTNNEETNDSLDIMIAKLKAIKNTLEFNHVPVSARTIKAIYLKKSTKTPTLISAANEFLKNAKKLEEKEHLAPGTVTTYITRIKNLIKYLTASRQKVITIDQVSFSFATQYLNWLKTETDIKDHNYACKKGNIAISFFVFLSACVDPFSPIKTFVDHIFIKFHCFGITKTGFTCKYPKINNFSEWN